MKTRNQIVFYVLMIASIVCMFLPLATFEDISLSLLEEDIVKYEERVISYQERYDGYVEDGKDQDRLDTQMAKVVDAQETVDSLKAELEEKLAAGEDAGAVHISLMDAGVPEELSMDNVRINESGVYLPNLEQFPYLTYGALALLIGAILLFALGRNQLVSKFYTASSVLNLIAIFVLVYNVLRIAALPIKSPYSDPSLTGVQWALVALPLIAMFVNIFSFQNTKKTMIYILCTFLCAMSILPFWIMMVNGTRTTYEIQQGVSLLFGSALSSNWNILTGKSFDVLIGFRNSAIIAFGSTFLSVYFSALTAYGLTAYRFKGRDLMFSFIVGIIMIPTQVTATGFYMFMYQIGWTNSFLPLILQAIAAPATVFFLRQYLQANLQISLVEAARIDGAGEFYTFNRIIVPIMVPALATMGIMAVIGAWNNYLTPLMLLSEPNLATLPMMVQMLRGDIYRTEYGSIYLGLTVTALPLLIVYFAFSKYIIRGVAVGGVKE